jgi:predicted PurR-regulated permease PerM
MWPGGSPTAVNGAAGLTIVALIIAALYFGRDLLIPLAVAGILSFILAPLLRRLTNWGLPRGAAVAIVIAAVVAALTAGVTLAGRQVAALIEDVPRYELNLRDKASFVHSFFGAPGTWQRAVETLQRVAEEVRNPGTDGEPLKIEVAQNSSQPIAVLLSFTRSTLPSLATAGLALLFTIFILLQYSDLRERAVRLMGAKEIGRSTQALTEAGSDLARFFLLQASLNASFGAVVGLALWAIGLPSAGLYGAIAAFMRFIPYVGSFGAAVLPLAVAAMIDPGWWKIVETAAVFLIGEPLVGQIVEPLLFGTHTRLSPIAVLVGAAFWALLWGPVGLILAVPLTLAVVVMGQHLPRLEFLSILLGNEPVLEPPERLYRQLLAGEAAEAAREFDRLRHDEPFVRYLDEVAVPALALASRDHRGGVFEADELARLKAALHDYIAHLRELLDFRRERQQLGSRTSLAVPYQTASTTALVIAGRGFLDQAAAELVADAIRFDLGIPAQCPSLGGLTGISAAADAASDRAPDFVALVSIGEVTSVQLDLLLHRIERLFAASTILVGNWGELRGASKPQHVVELVEAESPAMLVESIGRLAAERSTKPASRLEAV